VVLLTSPTDALAHLNFPDAPRMVTPPPGPESRRLLERQSQRESNARTYPRGLPIAPAEARGATLKEVDGNVYIDCLAGAGALNAGHNNPFIVEEVQRFLSSDHVLTSLDLPTVPKDRFVECLFEILPAPLRERGRIQFCGPTGSDAVDAAIKLVKHATGRGEILAFQGAYHGMGQGPLTLMGNTGPKRGLGPLLPGVHFQPYGHCGSCALGLTVDRCDLACARMVGSVLEDPFSGIAEPAAIILEAIQGEAGTIVPPDGWLEKVAGYARANSVPLICDEIQTGLGRTGRWFAFEHDGIVPDVVILSKSIGGLGFPISVIVYDESLDVWGPGAHAGTFRGNQIAMVAGAAAIDFIRDYDLVEHAAVLGRRLLADLHGALDSSPLVRQVRGRGLMIGVELTETSVARAMRAACLRRGLIIELGGRGDRTLRLLPPLVLTEELAARVGTILVDALTEVERGEASP
jgi:diaminobutyrate-2-oxoglutarate transaminase